MSRPNGEAAALLVNPLLNAWWDDQEARAVEAFAATADPVFGGKPDDPDIRLRAAIRLRVIRDMRMDLRLFADGIQATPSHSPPATAG